MESPIRVLRKKAGFTLAEVAKIAGCTSATISRYECGKRKLPVLMAKKLGAMFNVGWETLYAEDGDGKTA